jgi:protein-tyrosine phosphatase
MDISPVAPRRYSSSFFGQTIQANQSSADIDLGDWLINDDIDLIEKVVRDFRLQRLSMVQSLRQFVLCYESIIEWLAEQAPRTA